MLQKFRIHKSCPAFRGVVAFLCCMFLGFGTVATLKAIAPKSEYQKCYAFHSLFGFFVEMSDEEKQQFLYEHCRFTENKKAEES